MKKNSKCLDMVPNLTHFEIFFKMRWVGPKFNTLWTIFSKCIAAGQTFVLHDQSLCEILPSFSLPILHKPWPVLLWTASGHSWKPDLEVTVLLLSQTSPCVVGASFSSPQGSPWTFSARPELLALCLFVQSSAPVKSIMVSKSVLFS